MAHGEEKIKRFQFRIGHMLWITAVVAISSLALADAVNREILNFWMVAEGLISVGVLASLPWWRGIP